MAQPTAGVAAGATGRGAVVEAFDEGDLGVGEQWADQADHVVGREAAEVGVDPDDHIASAASDARPQRIALAGGGTGLGEHVGDRNDPCASGGCDLGCRVRAAIVHHHDLVDETTVPKVRDRLHDLPHGLGLVASWHAHRNGGGALEFAETRQVEVAGFEALGLVEGDKIDCVDGREGVIGHDWLTARTGSTDADPEMFPPPDTCRLLPVGDFGVQRSKVRWSERFPIRSAK